MKQKPKLPSSLMNDLTTKINAHFDELFKEASKLMVYRHGHTVTANEAAEGASEINTTMPGNITGHMIQIYRAGNIVTGDAVVSVNGGNLIVESGAALYEMEAGDVISWLAY